MTVLLELPRIRFELTSYSFLRRTADYAITDRHGAPLGAVRQRIGSAWRWANRFFAEPSTSPRATLDVLDLAGSIVFTIEKSTARWNDIDAAVTTRDGAPVGRVSSHGARFRRAGAQLFGPAGAPVAAAQRTHGLDFVVLDGSGSVVASVTKDVVTLLSIPAGRDNLNAYEIEFGEAADRTVRMLTLAAGVCLDLRHLA